MFLSTNGVDIPLGFVDESTPGGIALSEFNSCIKIVGATMVHLRVRVRLDTLVRLLIFVVAALIS